MDVCTKDIERQRDTHRAVVGRAVRVYRVENGIKYQADLARRLGVDPRTLSTVLRQNEASRPIAIELAKLGIPICTMCGKAACPGCAKKA